MKTAYIIIMEKDFTEHHFIAASLSIKDGMIHVYDKDRNCIGTVPADGSEIVKA